MVMTLGISALIGLALGRRFNVFILIPTIILGLVGATGIAVARGEQAWYVVLTIIMAATTLQISYLIGGITHAVFARNIPSWENYRCGANYSGADGSCGI